MIVDSDADPGRNWRRLARVGALLSTAILITSSSLSSWRFYEIMLKVAWHPDPIISGLRLNLRLFCCPLLTTNLIGPTMLIPTSQRSVHPGRRQINSARLYSFGS
jgi:hypothetical protein